MLLQLLQDGLSVLRRPNLTSFKDHQKDNTTWPLIYFAIGAGLAIVLSIIRLPAQQAYIAQQQAQLGPAANNPLYSSLTNATQTPSILIALGIFGYFYSLVIWILVPYAAGRLLNGKGTWGQVAYNAAAVNVPISVLDGLISFGLLTPLSCLFLIVSLSLDVARIYLTTVGTQAAMGLEERGDFWKLGAMLVVAVVVGLVISSVVAVGLSGLLAGH
jgi:hypothetical protein